MNIGIDAINFYTSSYYLELADLAKARQIDQHKFSDGLGEIQMSIAPPDEDVVTLAAAACHRLLQRINPANIDTLLFATESGIDHSKSAGVYLHRLLQLPPRCSVVELKQACYSGTAALQMALGLIEKKPERKVLVVAADIARYGLNTPGECSQGCGAVAMLISQNPRLLCIEPQRGFYTEDVMDFWRPNYCHEAIVDGKFSLEMYQRALEQAWLHYRAESQLNFLDHAFHCYHTPVPHLVEKAHQHLASINQINLDETEIKSQMAKGLHYSRIVGNCYTASLYLNFASLLDHLADSYEGARIGFYSYGSGCVGEYFSGILQPNYRNILDSRYHQDLIQRRQRLSFENYEAWHNFHLPEDGSICILPNSSHNQKFRLKGIENHRRQYESL